MSESEAVTSNPGRQGVSVRVVGGWKLLPRKLRIGVVAAALIVIGTAVYMAVFSSSATLNLVVRHSVRSGELSIYIDGKLMRVERISGSTKKRFGVLETRASGSFSRSLSVPAGRHVVYVRLRSSDGSEIAKSCGANVVAGQDATVTVNAQRAAMYLTYEGPPVGASAQESLAGYASSLRNLLVTIAGSAASAAVAFVVQEALRSRKNPPATA